MLFVAEWAFTNADETAMLSESAASGQRVKALHAAAASAMTDQSGGLRIIRAVGVFAPGWIASACETTGQPASFESLFRMATVRSVTIGIFDDARNVARAVEDLGAAGFQDTIVYDADSARHEQQDAPVVGPVPVGSILAPGSVCAEDSGSGEPAVRACKSHLAHYHLPEEVIEGYTTTFCHHGKFVLVRTHPQRDEEVVRILRKCGASRVNRYD
jgi:hypothetical protein